MSYKSWKDKIKSYEGWLNRCGVDVEDIKKRIKAGDDIDIIMDGIYDIMKKGMRQKEQNTDYDFDEVWKEKLVDELELNFSKVLKPVSIKEDITERELEKQITINYTIKRNRNIIVQHKIIGKKPKTITGLKCAITYFRTHKDSLTDYQYIRADVAMDSLKNRRKDLSIEEIKKYFEW